MSDKVIRTINLKALNYKKGKKKDFSPPRIEDVLENSWNSATSTRELLFPKLGEKKDDLHFFMTHGKKTKHGFTFQLCSFVPDYFPNSIPIDFDKKNIDVDPVQPTDDDGNPRQVVYVTHVLAFGNVLVVESVKGGGGSWGLSRYLTYLARKQNGAKFPRIELIDTATRNVRLAIRNGGGAKSVELALAIPTSSEDCPYAKMLTEVNNQIGGSQKLKVTWEGAKLSEAEVEDAFEEADYYDAIDRINIHLNNGDVVNLGKHKIKTRVEVNAADGKNPNSTELTNELKKYLLELMKVKKGMSILTEKGNLSKHVSWDE